MASTPSAWRRYLRFWGPNVDADVDDELRFHLEQLTAEYEARGLTHLAAVRAASERFGNAATIERALRAHDRQRLRRQEWLDRARLRAEQLRVAARGLRRAPGFTIAAVLTLALGIGFATAVFDVASTLLLRPLPVRDEARVVVLSGRTHDATISDYPLPLADAREYIRNARMLSGAALFSYYGAVPEPIVQGDRIEPMKEAQVSGRYFETLGARPAIGRLLRDDDDVVGAAPVAVLSYDAWVRYFAHDPAVLGHSLTLHSTGTSYTVVGVAPKGLGFPPQTDFWVPVAPSTPAGGERFVAVNVIGRLAPGRTLEQARAQLGAFYKRPMAPKAESALSPTARTLRATVLGDARRAALVFTAAVALLLLVTCINVGTLMLVRGLARTQELAVRSALGARRGQLTALLLTEGSLLALVGGTLGILLAALALKVFSAFAPATLPRLTEVGLGWQTVGVAIVVTSLTVLAFAVLPALRQSHVDAGEVLRAGTQRIAGRSARRVMEWLVAAQMALAVVLLSGAVLLARSLYTLERADLAFDGPRLVVAELSLRQGEYDALPQQVALLDRLVAAVVQLPGVAAVSPVVAAPFAGSAGWDLRAVVEGQTADDAAKNPMLNVDVVGPDYFRTLGIPVLEGRTFTDADREAAPRVVLVSRSAARALWPRGEAIGRRLTVEGSAAPVFMVVGVVEDTRYRDLREARASIYFPLHQPFFPFAPMTLVVRASGALGPVLPALREVVRQTAPGVTISRAAPFEDLWRAPLAQPRLNALLLALFAGAAVVLAAVGLFGVMSTVVRQRTREIGVRMALGATERAVQQLILRRGLAIAAAGALLGLSGALLLNRSLSSLLYGVAPTDALTLGTTVAVLMLVAGVASLLPARAAARVDPAVALRADT